jgi:hypothetical protein
MTPTESASSAQVPKKTQPEQYDLVVLGDGIDARCVDVCRRRKACRRGGAKIHRRIVPEHRMPSEQKHHRQREDRDVLSRAGTRRNRQAWFGD